MLFKEYLKSLEIDYIQFLKDIFLFITKFSGLDKFIKSYRQNIL